MKKEKKTVVFVSHDMSAVREYCDSAVLLEGSEIVAMGETDEVAKKYTKLFTVSSKKAIGEDSNRLGGEIIKTRRVEASINDGDIIITQHIFAESEVLNPVVGIRIRSASGADITGTNTRIEKFKTGRFEAKKERVVVWTLPNVLSDGEYIMDPAILESNVSTVVDLWEEAVKRKVMTERRLPCLIDPGFSVKIKGE